jgi:hypothetical protein
MVWFVVICIIGVVITYVTGNNDYAVSYDDVIENNDNSVEYSEKIVVYVEPTHYEVRTKALSIVNDTFEGVNNNSEAWKIWSINYWVLEHIDYVEDPPGDRYTNAYGVLQKKYGDCNDFSILLASMYESVGLDAALVFINTDDIPGVDHMSCLVYWPDNEESFLAEEKAFMKYRKITSPVSKVRAKHVFAGTSHLMLGKYNSGILLFADASMSKAGSLVGHITHQPYDVVEIIDVGK